MIELLLNTIYAVRAGSWDLLLEYAREIIPHYFAYNNGRIYFKNLAVLTPQDFKSMFGHFTTLCMKEFKGDGNFICLMHG